MHKIDFKLMYFKPRTT